MCDELNKDVVKATREWDALDARMKYWIEQADLLEQLVLQ
jgi:hypothetical protein